MSASTSKAHFYSISVRVKAKDLSSLELLAAAEVIVRYRAQLPLTASAIFPFNITSVTVASKSPLFIMILTLNRLDIRYRKYL